MTSTNRASAQELFWRRALAATALASLAAIGWGAFGRLATSASLARASALSCPRPTTTCSAGETRNTAVYVAKPGDTVWAIAVRYAGDQDPRPIEYQVEAQLGGRPLQPGDVLRVP